MTTSKTNRHFNGFSWLTVTHTVIGITATGRLRVLVTVAGRPDDDFVAFVSREDW